jgi:hypothetical protein
MHPCEDNANSISLSLSQPLLTFRFFAASKTCPHIQPPSFGESRGQQHARVAGLRNDTSSAEIAINAKK